MYEDFFDTDFDIYEMNAKDVIEQITIDEVEQFLRSLGVVKINRTRGTLICPTICHNPIDEADSMKLYYYDSTKNFHCYTQCSDNFSIITLYQRYMEINHSKVSFYEALDYVKQFLKVGTSKYIHPVEVEEYGTKKKIASITLPEYDNRVLDCFDKYYHPLWLKENISKEAMDKFDIRFHYGMNKIIIPHYDIDGRLVGIRGRAISKEDMEFGKYRPIYLGDKMYAHQLGFNLYGINEAKDAIKALKRAYIFEGEKSCLLSRTYYGDESIAVATCGSQLNRFQIDLLTKKLHVNEIILCYDKEYDHPYSEKGKKYRQKLKDKCLKYQGLATFYYVFDEHGLLNEKDSPIDQGKEVFEKLLNKKYKIG